ncbi:hypothetical protein BDW69DRAFT_182397 [Aspergillus filifer]
MGTRGLLFVRYKGRYFIYYNHFDSYPEGLGEAIVATIPADPDKYQAWLESLKATYSRLCLQYESNILCVLHKFGLSSADISPIERHSRSYHGLDHRLTEPPTQALLEDYANDIFIEWTYTIDLDREVLGVDQAAFFNLQRLPHHPEWARYLKIDRRRRRVLSKSTPLDLVAAQESSIQGADDQARTRFESFHVETQVPEVLRSFKPANIAREALLVRAISETCYKYRAVIDRFYREWDSTSFVFRELAFAILSIAAGEIVFQAPQDLNGRFKDEGFYFIPNAKDPDGQQSLLPRFLYECHHPGTCSGSAPRRNPFWLGNVFVYLTPGTNDVEAEKVAIATIVDNGLSQGLTSFHGLVFSLLDFVLLQVTKESDENIRVIKSPFMDLLYFDDTTSRYLDGPRSRYQKPSSLVNSIAAQDDQREEHSDSDDSDIEGGRNDDATKSRGSTWFSSPSAIMLLQFFDATADQHLAGALSRIFPNEILMQIMKHSDYQTYLTLSRVSASCRYAYYRAFRLNDDYAIVNQECDLTTPSFVLRDLSTGHEMVSSLVCTDAGNIWGSPKNVLHPVIGLLDPDRMSILDSLSFDLDFSAKRSPYKSNPDEPFVVRDYNRFEYQNGLGPEKVFELPSGAPLDIYLGAFESYILGTLRKNGDPQFESFNMQGARWQCLLPCGYEELSLRLPRCSDFRIILRSASDESAEEWKKTIEYAAQGLQKSEERGPDFRWNHEAKGSPVVVAFDRKVKVFYHVNYKAEPSLSISDAYPQCSKFTEMCKELDPNRRLIQLVDSDAHINLDDKESREAFESWFCSFLNPESNLEDWNNVTAWLKQVAKVSALNQATGSTT